jgi:hypothetical protein
MVPPEFINFFSVSAAVGATLVGLIFVAVSIAPEHIVMDSAPVERQAVAASSLTALLNPFFLSIVALIPHTSMGLIALILSSVSALNSLYLAWRLLKERQRLLAAMRKLLLIAAALVIYGYEFSAGLRLTMAPSQSDPLYLLTGVMIGAYAFGLLRAWELLGARRFGITNWLISPLRSTNEKVPLRTTEQPETTSKTPRDGN